MRLDFGALRGTGSYRFDGALRARICSHLADFVPRRESAGGLRRAAVAITLVGDAATRTVRAYRTEGQTFGPADSADALMLDGTRWQVTEDALVSPEGRKLHRLPGHIAYWFAWSGYLGKSGELATATN